MKPWIEWVPRWSKQPSTREPTVAGRYEKFDPMDEGAPRQHVECRCNVCGEEFRTLCESGNPTAHISRFALTHQASHFDAIGVPR